MDDRKYPTPLEDISAIEYRENYYLIQKELKASLEDLDKSEGKKINLKEILQEDKYYITRPKYLIKKFRERHREVNKQLRKENANITRLKVQVEERKRIEEFMNAMVKIKIDECTRL